MNKKRPAWLAVAIREQRKFEAWLERKELRLQRRIAASRNRLVKSLANSAEFGFAGDYALARRMHTDDMLAILTQAYREIIQQRATQVMGAIRSMKRDPNYTGFFESLIQSWISANALSKAQSIAETAIDDVRKVVAREQRRGAGNREIAQAIRKVALLTPSRALTIARTETHGAAMHASESVAKRATVDFGITLTKHWISTLDARTRDAHAAMNPETGKALNEDFIVGGVPMSRPGDPRGGAANVINCRCNLFYREVEDADESL